MENYVLGFFQQQLSKIIIGFRKEQVNANLLNGKGEIRDVKLNCSVLNQAVVDDLPFVAFEEIHVSRLGFNVTSWANLRKAPIQVDIGVITAVVVEPLEYQCKAKVQKSFDMVTEKELVRLIEEGLFKKFRRTGSYGLVDRIVDNLSIEIERFNFTFHTLGKFKTKRIGPWTPPILQVECKNLRIVAVDIHGHEASPDQVWNHNRHQRQAFLLCKKVTMESSVHIISSTSPELKFTLINTMSIETQLAIRQRLRDGEILAVQSDVTIPTLDLNIELQHLPYLASLLVGIQYCISKDRSFIDPLKPHVSQTHDDSKDGADKMRVRTSSTDSILLNESMNLEDSFGSTEIDNLSASTYDSENEDTQSKEPLAEESFQSERPILLLPQGLSIHENLCITCSVHHLSIKGLYNDDQDGQFQIFAGGSIVEAIWPKSNKDFGFYGQASVSYCSIQERYNDQMKILLMNGMRQEDHLSFRESIKARQEVNADANFPLFERRSIRQDPLDLRHSFPSQGFGHKITVDFLASDLKKPKVLNEMGMDGLEVLLDVQSWFRILKFAQHQAGGGYDSRILSGDWSGLLTTEMMKDEIGSKFILDNHLQHIKQLYFDESFTISSDLFNATLRFSNIALRIPATIEENIQACDLLTELKEATVVVTSALPRTFLSGKIGKENSIDFPNDPSDIVYALGQGDDGGSASIFRQQVTIRGFQIKIIPVIPYGSALEAQRLIEPSDVTLIASLESQLPNKGYNQTKIVLFLSIQIQKLFLNIDFGLLAGATTTLIHHGSSLDTLLKQINESDLRSSLDSATDAINMHEMNLHGILAKVHQRVTESIESEGLAIVVCCHQVELGIAIWHHLQSDSDSGCSQPVRLFDLSMEDFELGFEYGFHDLGMRQAILKCCLEKLAMKVFNMSNKATTESNMVEVLTFGVESLPGNIRTSQSKKDKQFALRLEEQLKGSRSWSMAVDLTSPAVLNVCIDPIKESLLLCLEALLMPMWSKQDSSAKNGSLFPVNTVGAILYSLIDRMTMKVEKDIFRDLSFQYDQTSSDSFMEQLLRKASKTFLPENLSLILFRLGLEDLLVQLPVDGQRKENLGVHLNQSDFCFRFKLITDDENSNLGNILASKGQPWSSLVPTTDNGFYQSYFSRSSLVFISHKETAVTYEPLINPCGIRVTHVGGKIEVSMSESLCVNDIRLIEDVALKLKSVVERSYKDLLGFVSSVAEIDNDFSVKMLIGDKEIDGKHESISQINSTRLQDLSILMGKVYEQLGLYERIVHDVLRERDSEMNALKHQVFTKEKERFGALALLSSRIAGWIRMGGVHVSGQRVSRKSTMWPYWAILRKDLILLFNAPGDPKPQDVILLVGARIREVSGGTSIKRGFAIIESGGRTCYFVASTGAEYRVWTQEISSALAICNFDAANIEEGDESQVESNGDVADHDFAEASGLSPTDVMIESDEVESGQRQRLALGNKLASAKSKFGSVLQTAKDKGKEISNRKRTSSSDLDASGRASIGSVDSEHDNNIGEGVVIGGSSPGMGKRFGGRLGSAMQSVRQKGREALERQGSSNPSLNAPPSSDTLSPVPEGEAGSGVNESRLDGTRRKILDIGAAVKRGVKSNLSNTQQNSFRTGQSEEIVGPPFGGGAITLKDIRASGRAPHSDESQFTTEPLKVFDRHWAVLVKVHQESSMAILEEKDENEDSKSIETTSSSNEEIIGLPISKFKIKVFQKDKIDTEPSFETLFGLDDILDLHTKVSEGIERIMPQLLREKFHPTLAERQGEEAEMGQDKFDMVEKVMMLGEILGGLLDLEGSPEIIEKSIKYQAEVIEFFLNTILQCPLPVDVVSYLADELGISASTKDPLTAVRSDLMRTAKDSSRGDVKKILDLLSACQREMLHIKNVKPQERVQTVLPKVEWPKVDSDGLKALIPVPETPDLHPSIQQALMKAMAERDEATGKLLSSNILHMHEVEAVKRKNKLLEFELEVVKHSTKIKQQPPNVSQLFGTLRGEAVPNPADEVQKRLESKLNILKLENNDDMIFALSQQIADEIRTKTMYASEIERLKESRIIEKEREAAELKALREELKETKELLASEKKEK